MHGKELTMYSSSADRRVSVISGSAVTNGLRSSSPIDLVTYGGQNIDQNTCNDHKLSNGI